MPAFGVETIRELIANSASPCVSVYFPTHRAGPEARQDPIQLKNALADAEEQLLGDGWRRREADEFLGPARALIDRPEIWQRRVQGFALFLSPTIFRHLTLGISFNDLVVVGRRFHFKPLLPLLTGNGRFYILTLSQNQVRLLEGSREGARELTAPGMPRRLEEGINLDVKQHYFQKQLRDPHSTTERSEVMDAMLEPFLIRVDTAVTAILEEQRAPLVLAGVKRIQTAYRLLSKYDLVLEPGVDGNPEELDGRELHAKAWQLVQPIFLADRDKEISRYRDLLGTGREGHDLGAVLRAAVDGRVEALFVPVEENVWGRFDPASSELDVLAAPDGEDLLDRAALEVLLRRGVVYAVPRAEMPGPGAVNAVYRY